MRYFIARAPRKAEIEVLAPRVNNETRAQV